MTPEDRALLMLELKQDRRERQLYGSRGAPTDDEIRRRNARRYLGTTNRNRPRLTRGAKPSDIRAWEANDGGRGGYRAGEELRDIYESARREGRASAPFGVPASSEEHLALARRMNVRTVSARPREANGRLSPGGGVGYPGRRTLTPSQRVNQIGTLSRRRSVSPGLVPSGPPRRRQRVFGIF